MRDHNDRTTLTTGKIPTDRIPTDRVPTDTRPDDRVPTDVAPRDTIPTDAVPTDRVPTDAEPTDRVPTDAEPADRVPTDARPDDESARRPPVDEAVVDPAPAERASAEAGVVYGQLNESAPSDEVARAEAQARAEDSEPEPVVGTAPVSHDNPDEAVRASDEPDRDPADRTWVSPDGETVGPESPGHVDGVPFQDAPVPPTTMDGARDDATVDHTPDATGATRLTTDRAVEPTTTSGDAYPTIDDDTGPAAPTAVDTYPSDDRTSDAGPSDGVIDGRATDEDRADGVIDGWATDGGRSDGVIDGRAAGDVYRAEGDVQVAAAGDDTLARGEDVSAPGETGTPDADGTVVGQRPGDVESDPVADLWPADAADTLRARWRQIQLDFVDDPEAAVRDADSLVAEAVDTLTSALAARRDELSNLHAAQTTDTEQLRVTVQRHREFLDQLLTL